ncbi:MAG: hypothetical protein ACREDG_06195, partial [Methylocella sp.]
ILVDPLNTDEIADGMRRLAHMGQEDGPARLPALRQTIARFSRNLARAALHITTSARAVIVRATVFTGVLQQSRAKGSSCT